MFRPKYRWMRTDREHDLAFRASQPVAPFYQAEDGKWYSRATGEELERLTLAQALERWTKKPKEGKK